MKTLYLHIGTPKTATSSIQHFCFNNRELLRKKGYCYPRMPFSYPRLDPTRNALFLQCAIYDETGERDYEAEKANLKRGMDIVRKLFRHFPNVVLSDEVLWLAGYERRATLYQEVFDAGQKYGFQVKVVVYLRRQDQFISSWWNQKVKKDRKPLTMPWEEYRHHFPVNLQPDYDAALARIAAVVGRENMIVRKFERGSFYKGMIEADFLKAIGLEMTDEFEMLEAQYNIGRLSGNTHEIKRILNTLPALRLDEDTFFWFAFKDFVSISDREYPNSVLSADEAREFLEPYLESNRRVAKEYFGEDSLLFDMTFKDTPKWERDNPRMLDDVIRFSASASRQLLNRIEDQRKNLEQIREVSRDLEERLEKLESRKRRSRRSSGGEDHTGSST